MRIRILLYLEFSLVILLFSCNSKVPGPQETLAKIITADNAGDLEKIVSLYTRDAILLPPNRPNISGQDSIRKNYEAIFATSKLALTANTDEINESGDLAFIRGNTIGTVTNLKDSSITPVNDKFIMILKSQADGWKIFRLMWNRGE
jgi:uncharacterized protein (TIGR02246 family)